jgi:hypothetical protein
MMKPPRAGHGGERDALGFENGRGYGVTVTVACIEG